MGLPSPRPKFGYEKAVSLLELLEMYHKKGLDEKRYSYVEGLSVLGAYLAFTDNDVALLKDRYKALADGSDKNHAGVDYVPDMDAIYNLLDLEQDAYFIKSRHSIRCYDKRPVDKDTLRKVVELASCAPSACNRQPVKVYATTDTDTVKAVSALIPGNKGFEDEVSNWAIITVNRDSFGTSEPLQWYVDGGIYLGYLVQSFHAYHIASCIFQIPATHADTPKLRELVGIPGNEAVIAAVGFGYARKENKFLAAERRPVDLLPVHRNEEIFA